MCKVTWCKNEAEKYKNGKSKTYCSIHTQYSKLASNASSRPWLFYKVEKIVMGELKCEKCGFSPTQHYPNLNIRIASSLMDVDHKNPLTKGTLEGEQPSNYQLLCKHCHIIKSHEEGDFIPKHLKKLKN